MEGWGFFDSKNGFTAIWSYDTSFCNFLFSNYKATAEKGESAQRYVV